MTEVHTQIPTLTWLDRVGAINALLSIALSIAKEETPSDPIRAINESLEEIQELQDPIDLL
jgi:hypothetical protein